MHGTNRVLYYVTASYPFGTGESFVGAEIAEWVSRGYDVRIIPTYARGSLCEGARQLGVLINVRMFSLRTIWSALHRLFRSPGAVMAAYADLVRSPRYLAKNALVVTKACAVVAVIPFDAKAHIHAHWGGTSSTMAMTLARLTGVPWSLTCHRWDIYANNLLALKSRSARFVRFISEQGRDEGLRLGVGASKAVVIHMGVASVVNQPVKSRPASPPVVACVANLIDVKGHRYLIEAVSMLKKRGKQPVLRLFGDGYLREALTRQCQGHGLGTQVIFEGHRPQSELMDAYANGEIDLLVLPSIDLGRGEHEGVPVALMEAMSFGIPVVSTATGAIAELLPPELGVTVAERDAKALRDKIDEILGNETVYRSIGHEVLSIIRANWRIARAVDIMEHRIFGTRA